MDEGAALLVAENGSRGPAHGEGALEVDADDVVPIRLGEPVEDYVAQNAGAVDHPVEAAELSGRRVDEAVSGVPVADVAGVEHGLPATGPDLVDDLLARCCVRTASVRPAAQIVD